MFGWRPLVRLEIGLSWVWLMSDGLVVRIVPCVNVPIMRCFESFNGIICSVILISPLKISFTFISQWMKL